ncbi:MAG: class I SAM-dependent methyltransferase [bacterium]
MDRPLAADPAGTVPCNLCGNDDPAPFLNVRGDDVVRCRRCGLVYVSPRIGVEKILEQYDESYFLKPFGYDDYVRHRKYFERTFRRRLADIRKFVPAGRILDVGCAAGFFLNLAREQGYETAGVDVCETMVNYARGRLGLDVFHGRLEDLAQREGMTASFDVVTMFDALEHFPDPSAELGFANLLMKENGLLVVTTPNVAALLPRILRARWEQYKPREHLYYFTNATLKAILQKTGFRAVRLGAVSRDMKLEHVMKRISTHVPALEPLSTRLLRSEWLRGLSLNVNPGYMTIAFARRERGVSSATRSI